MEVERVFKEKFYVFSIIIMLISWDPILIIDIAADPSDKFA